MSWQRIENKATRSLWMATNAEGRKIYAYTSELLAGHRPNEEPRAGYSSKKEALEALREQQANFLKMLEQSRAS